MCIVDGESEDPSPYHQEVTPVDAGVASTDLYLTCGVVDLDAESSL